MMDLQEIIVLIVVAISFIWVARKFYLFFKRARNNENPCANCSAKCSLRKEEKESE